MKELAKKIIQDINQICIEFYYFRRDSILKKSGKILSDIQMVFTQINLLVESNPEDADIEEIHKYIIGVMNDLLESIENKDIVLFVDTLDYGVRNIMEVFTDNEESEKYE